ncbi:MAG: response regulator [Alphaproteobacteria bacterium]|nr:response regulator [Alphaproteobacteria bacterium]
MQTKVLAVDDSRTMRDILSHALGEAGFEVDVAEDGAHGLEVAARFKPDVVISDINMPRLDGFGFIEMLRKDRELGAVPILVLTTESAPELKSRARAAGATGWIIKPFDGEKLVAAIRRVSA